MSVLQDNATFVQVELQTWFEQSGRIFPWRFDHDPYHVLIAELMLRRTQARQVIEVYKRFIRQYPNISTLDEAANEEVETVLYPLGLKWRAKNFKAVARQIILTHKGMIPTAQNELLALPGVGPYVTSAVLCFAFGKATVLADTNTVRVAARFFGFACNAESRRKKSVIEFIGQLVDKNKPDVSNYALLDFAALVCLPRRPLCGICPIASHCQYFLAT